MAKHGKHIDPANSAESLGNLFARGRTDEFKRVLCKKVREALNDPDAVTIDSIPQIIDQVVDLHESGSETLVTLNVRDGLLELCTNNHSRSLCANCNTSQCCANYKLIQLSSEDIERLGKRLNLAPRDFIEQHCKRIVEPNKGLVYALRNTMPCEFLGEAGCSVYESRPDACKDWPLVIDQQRPEIIKIRMRSYCNFLFNLIQYEVTLRVLGHIKQN